MKSTLEAPFDDAPPKTVINPTTTQTTTTTATVLFMSVDELVAVIDEQQPSVAAASSGLNFTPTAAATSTFNISQDQHHFVSPSLTYVYPPGSAIGGGNQYVFSSYHHYPDAQPYCYHHHQLPPPTVPAYSFMSTADFSLPPPAPTTATYRTTGNAAGAASGFVGSGGGMIVTSAPPPPIPGNSAESFGGGGDATTPTAYAPAENGQMTATAAAAYPYTTAVPNQSTIIAYNSGSSSQYPHAVQQQPQISSYSSSSSSQPQHYPHVKTMTIHNSQHKSNGGGGGGRNHHHHGTGSVAAFSSSDTSSTSFIKASATASDTASSCSGGGGGGGVGAGGRRASGSDTAVYYHRHHNHRNNHRNGNSSTTTTTTNGKSQQQQHRQYSDARPSTSRCQGQNSQQQQTPVNNIKRDAVVSNVGEIVLDAAPPPAKTSSIAAKSTGVDSVDSADSGLTADHSSPEHRTSTPTNAMHHHHNSDTIGGGGPSIVQAAYSPYQSSPQLQYHHHHLHQSPNVPPSRPQTLPPFHHSEPPTAVMMIAGSGGGVGRYEASVAATTVENQQQQSTSVHHNAGASSSTTTNTVNAAGGGAGESGGGTESRSSSPAPPLSSGGGDGGSNAGGGGSNPNTGVVVGGVHPVGPHAVYVHVNLGETLSVRVGNEIQHIPGPATVRMVSSHSAGPPLPLPLHVPPGHVVQQIVDETGTLRHLILSPQTPQPPPVTAGGGPPFPCVNLPTGPMSANVQFVPVNGNVPHAAAVRVHGPGPGPGPSTIAGTGVPPPNGPPVAVLAATSTTNDCPPGGVPYHLHHHHPPPLQQQPPLTAILQASSAPVVAVAPMSSAATGHVRQPLHLHTNPPHICQLHINGGNGEDGHLYAAGERGGGSFVGRAMNNSTNRAGGGGGGGKNAAGGMNNQSSNGVQRTYHNEYQEPETSSPLHDTTMDDNTSAATSGGNEDEEICKIAEMLSRIPPPQVCDIGPREALVQWQPFDCSEASASGGPFPQIDASEFTYEILLYERRPEGKPTNNYRCQADQLQQQWLSNLKPSTEYFVRLRALLEERGLQGEPSSALGFKTKPTHPDKMQPPRVVQRAKTTFSLRWLAPCDNGAKIAAFHLEVDENGTGDGAFREAYCGPLKQFKLQKLQPSTLYRVRVAASNQHGKGEFSDIFLVQTTGAAPASPEPPSLVQATSHSLALQWKHRDGDEEFQLLMEDPQTGHGYLPVAATRDVSYVVQSLMRFKEYRFRLAALNDEGRSMPSESVTFRTLPSRPQAPARPHAKGRVASNHVKIAWDCPRDTGGSEITQYFLDMCGGIDAADWSTIYEGTAQEHHVTGLEPGVSYRFRVACSSLGGRSPYSDDLSITTSPVPPGPCRPPVLHGRAKSTSLHIKWSPPEFLGGAEISEYELVKESAVQSPVRSTPSSPSSDSSTTTTAAISSSNHSSAAVYQGPRTDFVVSAGLLPGRTYAFRVRAYNRTGAGHWSERFECQTAPAPPECPRRLLAVGQTSSSVSLAWDAPPSDNGAQITEYRLHQASRNISRDIDSQEGDADSPDNTWQQQQAVQSVSPTRSRSVASDTPTSASTSSSTVRQAAESTGSPDAEYGAVTQISVGPGLNYEARALKPATDYVFRIQAVNNAGCSRLSDPLFTRTLPGVPDAPMSVKAEPYSLSEILVVWDSPLDNGSPIVGYYIDISRPPSQPTVSDSSSTTTTPPDTPASPIALPAGSTQHLVENLLPETMYRFRVQACNEVGIGPYSPSIKAATFSRPPPPPCLELAVASHNSLKLRWNEPATSSGLQSDQQNVITYAVEIENKNGAFSPVATDLSSRSCKVPRLSESTLYRFRARACSSTGGAGPWSDMFEFKTLRMPPTAVKNSPRIKDVTETSCQIDWAPIKLSSASGGGFSLTRGEKIHYSLQIQHCTTSTSNEDFRTVYKGPSTSFHVSGLAQGANYRVRVCSVRISPPDNTNMDGAGEEAETYGAPSPTSSFSTIASARRKSNENVSSDDGNENDTAASAANGGFTSMISGGPRQLSDRQWAVLILVVFSVVALLVAFTLQRFLPASESTAPAGAGNAPDQQTGFAK